MKIKKVWWLHPISAYLMILVLVGFALNMPAIRYNDIYHMEKAISFEYIWLYIASFLLFSIGYCFSTKYYINLHLPTDIFYEDTISFKSLYSIYKVILYICFFAYILWYLNFIRLQGASFFRMILAPTLLAEHTNYIYNHAGRISGITTFTEFGIVAMPLGVYLHGAIDDTRKKKSIVIQLFILTVFALMRAVLFNERLSLIELFFPAFITFLVSKKYTRHRIFINAIPIIGVAVLFVVFAIFEYPRSWLNYYVYYYDSYFEFIKNRLIGYYCGSINTECIYIKHIPVNYIPHLTLDWIWHFPGLDKIAANLFRPYVDILNTYGNPEFNNSSGILAFFRDYGMFAIFLQPLFGFFIGRAYYMFRNSNILFTIIYSYVFMSLIELPRFFSFGTLRFFYFSVAIIILLLLTKRSPESIHLKKSEEELSI